MVLQRPSAGYQLALGAISLLMVSVVLESLAEFWRMPVTGGQIFLLSLGSIAFAWAWWRSAWLGAGATAAAAAGGLVALRYSPAYVAWLSRVAQEAMDLYDRLRMAEIETTFGTTVGTVLLALIGLLFGLFIVWEGFSRGAAFWSIIGGIILFGTQWAWFFDRSSTFFMGFMLLSLMLWTLSQAAQRDARWQTSGRRIGYRSHVTTPLAIVFAASIFGTVLPTEFAPIQLGEVGEKFQEAFPVVKRLRGGGAGGVGARFSLAATGFTANLENLGGPVNLDQTVALYLTPERPLPETVYLRGATFLVYTGRSWQAGESQKVQLPTDGTMPTSYAPDVLRDYVNLKVTPALSFGRTVFNVLEPMRVSGLKSGYSTDADSNIFADRSIARESTYQVAARLPRYSADQIRLLSTSAPEGYFKSYLQLPESLPERVRTLGRKITAGVQHPYNQALAIESFLRTMKYDLQVPPTPAGRDFVDFFLFDLGRGYCTYYATGMVVMLRDQGIPARLVEGFAVPASAEYTEDGKGVRTYSVLNSQAHAWVEAYFPGYGWVTFDPTPRADLPVIARNTPAPEPGGAVPASAGGDERPFPDGENQDANFDDPSAPAGGSAIVAAAAREWPWFITPLLVLAALAFVAYRYLLTQDRLAARESRTLVQEVWEKASGLLSRFDFGRRPHQTPREYAASLGESFPILKEPAIQVAEDYTVARYGPPGGPVDEEAGERARSFWQQAHAELFSRYGWRTYFLRRLRPGKGKKPL